MNFGQIMERSMRVQEEARRKGQDPHKASVDFLNGVNTGIEASLVSTDGFGTDVTAKEDSHA